MIEVTTYKNQVTFLKASIFLFNSMQALSISSFAFAPVKTTFPDANIKADYDNIVENLEDGRGTQAAETAKLMRDFKPDLSGNK